MATLHELALEEAITQIGEEESPRGSNWGHPVQDYLASVGIGFAASWCMAFVYWCYQHAAEQLGQPNPLFKTGGVLSQWNNSPKNHVSQLAVQAGDIFIMNLGKGLGHTGFVESVNEDGSLNTIEGNTNDTGSREGYEVCRRKRNNTHPIIGFLRF